MRTTTTWSKLPVALEEIGPGLRRLSGGEKGTNPETTRAARIRRADAEKATRARYDRESITVPGGGDGCQPASMMVFLKMFTGDNRKR